MATKCDVLPPLLVEKNLISSPTFFLFSSRFCAWALIRAFFELDDTFLAGLPVAEGLAIFPTKLAFREPRGENSLPF